MEQKLINQNNKQSPSLFISLLCIALAIIIPYLATTYFNRDTPRQQTKITRLNLPQKPTQNTSTPDKSIEKNIKYLVTRQGDSLASLFKRLGISATTLQSILTNNPHEARLKAIQPNQKIEFQFNPDNNQLEQLIIPLTSSQKLIIQRESDSFISRIQPIKLQSHLHYLTATVTDSLYQTGKRLNIPFKLLKQMSEIFNWQIDFSRDIRPGDQFTLIYKAYYNNEQLIGTGDIIAATFRNRGKEYQAIRYANEEKDYDYYDEEGISLRKAFDRYPVRFTYISSPFHLSRHHPILGITRPHRGVDLAARLGTPIKATGDGKIVKIGDYGAYGNMIEIKHNRRYTTRYAHMVKFHKGLKKGSRVKKGEVIGYVGQTGLADGPHCHYEFHIKGIARNPATIELPHASPVAKNKLAEFKAKATSLLAQLKLYQEAKLASNEKISHDTL